MRAAADLEASTEKHPVTPGAIIPARELLAEMLLDAGRRDEAIAELERVLRDAPQPPQRHAPRHTSTDTDRLKDTHRFLHPRSEHELTHTGLAVTDAARHGR